MCNYSHFMRRTLRHGSSWALLKEHSLSQEGLSQEESPEEPLGAGLAERRHRRGQAGGLEASLNEGVCTPGPGLGPPPPDTCLLRVTPGDPVGWRC